MRRSKASVRHHVESVAGRQQGRSSRNRRKAQGRPDGIAEAQAVRHQVGKSLSRSMNLSQCAPACRLKKNFSLRPSFICRSKPLSPKKQTGSIRPRISFNPGMVAWGFSIVPTEISCQKTDRLYATGLSVPAFDVTVPLPCIVSISFKYFSLVRCSVFDRTRSISISQVNLAVQQAQSA